VEMLKSAQTLTPREINLEALLTGQIEMPPVVVPASVNVSK